MLQLFYAAVAILSIFFTVSVGSCGEETFNTERMLLELEERLELSKEKLKSLQPTIEAKSKKLQKVVQESVDKGFVQVEEMNSSLDELSRETGKKVELFLNNDEILKLKEYLGKINKDTIRRTHEKLVAELTEVLELTEDQIEELKPVLDDSMAKMNSMITDLAKEGSKNWGAFKKQYGEMSRELKAKLKGTLDDSQMEKLEKYNKEKQEKIQQALFV